MVLIVLLANMDKRPMSYENYREVIPCIACGAVLGTTGPGQPTSMMENVNWLAYRVAEYGAGPWIAERVASSSVA